MTAKALTLLNNQKPDLLNESFSFYGKEYFIPNKGDIIIVEHCSFTTYYILVTKVLKGNGKSILYCGYALREKGSTGTGVSSPAFLIDRDQLEFTGRYHKINPKDRKRICRVSISSL